MQKGETGTALFEIQGNTCICTRELDVFADIIIEGTVTGKNIDIICFYDPQQTDYQPEPSDGDPRGAACTASTSYSARRPACGVRPLRQHIPRMYS